MSVTGKEIVDKYRVLVEQQYDLGKAIGTIRGKQLNTGHGLVTIFDKFNPIYAFDSKELADAEKDERPAVVLLVAEYKRLEMEVNMLLATHYYADTTVCM